MNFMVEILCLKRLKLKFKVENSAIANTLNSDFYPLVKTHMVKNFTYSQISLIKTKHKIKDKWIARTYRRIKSHKQPKSLFSFCRRSCVHQIATLKPKCDNIGLYSMSYTIMYSITMIEFFFYRFSRKRLPCIVSHFSSDMQQSWVRLWYDGVMFASKTLCLIWL